MGLSLFEILNDFPNSEQFPNKLMNVRASSFDPNSSGVINALSSSNPTNAFTQTGTATPGEPSLSIIYRDWKRKFGTAMGDGSPAQHAAIGVGQV